MLSTKKAVFINLATGPSGISRNSGHSVTRTSASAPLARSRTLLARTTRSLYSLSSSLLALGSNPAHVAPAFFSLPMILMAGERRTVEVPGL